MTERKPIGLTVPYREVGYKEKKGWVGLTIEEVQQILNDPRYQMKPMIVQAVEAKLKEKNEM